MRSIMNGPILLLEATKGTMGIRCSKELKELVLVGREYRNNWSLLMVGGGPPNLELMTCR
jgi:hypothetical protein